MKNKRKLERRGHKHVTRVGRHVVEDATAMVLHDENGEVELEYDEAVGYERRAARVVLQERKVIEGDVLRFARGALDLRQEDLAAIVGYTPTEISRFETGARPIPRAVQLAVAELLCRVEVEGDQVLTTLLDEGRSEPSTLTVREQRRAV